MTPQPLSSLTSLGADLRALRKARGVTLADLAARLGRSVGWLSQVERDISAPSIPELRQMAKALGVPMSLFFGQTPADPREAGFVVRKNARRPIGGGAAGLVEELLSPDLTDSFEVVHSEFLPGAALDEPAQRPTQELAYLVSGQLKIWVGDDEFILQAGDTIRLRGQPMRWANPFDETAVAIWVISPPVY